MKKPKGRAADKPGERFAGSVPQSGATRAQTPARKSKTSANRAGQQPDDHELWDHVAQTIEPLSLKGRVSTAITGEARSPVPKSAAGDDRSDKSGSVAPSASVAGKGAKKAGPNAKTTGAKKTTSKALSSPTPLDRRRTRALAKGRTAIDARIDLHGMRQWEAHARLQAFISRSYLEGHRTVLVITGKGTRIPAPEDDLLLSERREQGVLRRLVPAWLTGDAVISPFVTGFAAAAPRHGGDGALYVKIKAHGKSLHT